MGTGMGMGMGTGRGRELEQLLPLETSLAATLEFHYAKLGQQRRALSYENVITLGTS